MTRKFFGAKLDPAVWKAAKVAAAASSKEMWQFVEDAIRAAIPPQFRKGLK